MSGFSAEQRAELRNAISKSRREALAYSDGSATPPRMQAKDAAKTRAKERQAAKAKANQPLPEPPVTAPTTDELGLVAQVIYDRLYAAHDPRFCTIDLEEHLANVARVAAAAKKHPFNAYARPSL